MNRALFTACIVMLVGALIAGFSVVGGPNHARMQDADQKAMRALEQIRRKLICNKGKRPLPENWDDTEYCTNSLVYALNDTGPSFEENVRYERLSDQKFHICYDFQLEQDQIPRANRVKSIKWDGKTGCMSGQNSYVAPT